ncbi:MAG: SwmB domain-containing protein [Chloroflexota bacterium]|nr:SwmB domain-containing protein [Chloroflexota bacterium]
MQVSVTASPVNLPVYESTTLTATITNNPSEETPAYNWEIDFGGSWLSFGGSSTFRYGNGRAETLRFRLTVTYDSGKSATSEPVTVTWVVPEPTPEPTQDPTQEPTTSPTPTPMPVLTQEPTPEPTEEPTPEPTPAPDPSVTGVEVSSSPASGDTYLLGETIRVTLTFSEEVDVTGAPRLKIDMDPAHWGEKLASYAGGSGTASLTFTHTVMQPNYSTRGIAVLGSSLELNGGTIRSSSTQADADLAHIRLDHDANHKVDWQRTPQTPTPTPQTPTPAPAPSVTGLQVTSSPASGDTYLLGETIRVTLTFSEEVDVTGAPRLKIDMDPAHWGEKLASYAGGSGTASLTFTHTVVQPNYSTQGIAVLANSLELNGGTIRSSASQTNAALSHIRLDHNDDHRVDWQRSPPAQTPTATPEPTPAATPTPGPTPAATPTPEPGTPWVTDVAITSDPGSDNTYGGEDVIQVTMTFSETVNVTSARVSWARTHGGPKVMVHTGAVNGGQWATYQSGSGTASLTFAYKVYWPDLSTRGLAVPLNSLTLDGGTIKSAATGTDAILSHMGLDHNPDHLVDWQLSSQSAPQVTGLVIVSHPRSNDTYTTGELIRIRLVFSDSRLTVTGSPRLKFDLSPAEGDEVWANFDGSSGLYKYFTYMVVHPNVSNQGIAVLADTLELNGGSIRSRTSGMDAELAHGGLYYDPTLKVNGIRSLPPKKEVGNDPPICTGSAETISKRYAPPLQMSYYIGLYCADADGDELTFTVTSDPPGVAKHMSFDNAISRVWFQALGHCDLETITPTLPPESFTTTVTVTATDPHGASATGRAYFDTPYKLAVNYLTTGCPNLVSAESSGNRLTLTFDVDLDDDSVLATDDFVVKVDGEPVALADSGVRVDYNTVVLTLAAAVSGQPTVTVSYTPGDDPIRDDPMWGGAEAEAFEDYTVNFTQPSS